MGRAPCCDKTKVKRGPWSPEEDYALKNYVETYGTGGNWIALPQKAGLKRCGKSCRLRWLNYLRPNIKHGGFTEEEDNVILSLYHTIGSRWSVIASQLPGRTDNDVKNYWNTKLKKKPLAPIPGPSYPSTVTTANAAARATTGSYLASTNDNMNQNIVNFSANVDNVFWPYDANFINPEKNLTELPENTYAPGVWEYSPSFSVDNESGSWTSSLSGNGSWEEDAFLAGFMFDAQTYAVTESSYSGLWGSSILSYEQQSRT